MARSEGMNYAPKGKSEPVVGPGEFKFAAAHLDHGHIYGQCNGLIEAGAEMKYVFDTDPMRLKEFCKSYPQAEPVDDIRRILDDPEIQLVSAAAIPCDRGPIGLQVLDAGKHYFTDKSPFTTLEQLADARAKVKSSGKKVYGLLCGAIASGGRLSRWGNDQRRNYRRRSASTHHGTTPPF